MKTAFITGATGFLGRHIVDILLENGWKVTAFVRSTEKAKKLLDPNVTCVAGDLISTTSIKSAMPDNLDLVVHAAADTSMWSKDAKQQEETNIEGTRALLQAMPDKNAKRLVHVSSIATYGKHSEPITEASERLGATSWINYARTKSFAERKVKESVDRGLDAVIVNPTHIVGRYDSHNWARLITQLANGSLPAVPPGSGNFANGRAVAEAILAAFHKGTTGHNYILGGPHATFKEFLEIVSAELGGIKLPPMMPGPLLSLYAQGLASLSLITGRRPSITREEAHAVQEKVYAVCSKAEEELGYRQVPLEQSIRESIVYLRETGQLSA